MDDANAYAGVTPVPESFPEARRWMRHKVDIRLKVMPISGSASEVAFGRGNTLSHGGIGAYIPCSFSPGAAVHVELVFPGTTREVKVKALVRSCEGFRYGLEFVEMLPAIQAAIDKYCDDSDAS